VSEKNPIRVFVTHTFESNADYHRVFEYLESAANFFYINVGNPEQAPGSGGKEALKDELLTQIKLSEVVIVLAGLFREHRDWIGFQMDAAEATEKPLVALEPFGGIEDVPPEVAQRADETVGWNERHIVDAIRRQARHEETTRWDVIDFP
jgi:hypothetical protein